MCPLLVLAAYTDWIERGGQATRGYVLMLTELCAMVIICGALESSSLLLSYPTISPAYNITKILIITLKSFNP